MKLLIPKGKTSKTQVIFIQDSSSTTGAGLTGLLFNSAGLSAFYYREEAGTGGTQITLATQTIGTWATGGFIELDQTDMPGFYEVGIPDAALATGAEFVVMQFKGATNMAPLNLEIQLTGVDLGSDDFTTTQKASINTEVVDVLKVDQITLPGQEAPPLTPTFEEAISWNFKIARNRKTQTATDWKLFADDETTVDAKATVSDDGTTAIKQEIVSGP